MMGLAELLADPLLGEVAIGARPGMLMLDYDGTLAPFCADRDRARPYPGVAEALSRMPVLGPGRIVIVSGRQCPDIPPLLGLDAPPEIWGCHGAQRRLPDGTMTAPALAPEQSAALDQAADLAHRYLHGAAIERKPFSLALHFRGLGEDEREWIETRLSPKLAPLARNRGLVLHKFNGGVELRPTGIDKGRAVLALMAENSEAAIWYLGDDATDEDAFLRLGQRGRGVLVLDRERATNAVYRLRPPDELLAFMNRWAEIGHGRSETTKEKA